MCSEAGFLAHMLQTSALANVNDALLIIGHKMHVRPTATPRQTIRASLMATKLKYKTQIKCVCRYGMKISHTELCIKFYRIDKRTGAGLLVALNNFRSWHSYFLARQKCVVQVLWRVSLYNHVPSLCIWQMQLKCLKAPNRSLVDFCCG